MRVLPSLVLALAIGACNQTDDKELSRRVQALDAIAAEGQVLADGVARDRTKATFARVHARVLAEEAQHEAEKLADAPVEPQLKRQRERAVAIAQRLGEALTLLQTYPGAEGKGALAGRKVAAAGDEAQRLDGEIADAGR